MSNFSDLFPTGGSGLPSNFVKDPRHLFVVDGTLYTSAGHSSAQSDSATFWNHITAAGAVNTAAVAGVYNTVCDIVGRGVLFSVISPSMFSTADVASWRITVDGEEYIIERGGPWAGTGVSGRPCLGAVSPLPDTAFTTAAQAQNWGSVSARTDRLKSPNYVYVLPPAAALLFGMPVLFFEESLKVETKVSAFAVAGAYVRYSGAVYQLLG